MPSLRTNQPVPPLGLVLFFLVLGLAAYTFSLPETWAIGITLGAFLVLTALHPLNGVSFLWLVIPFFLGNPFKPYQFLLEIFVYATLLSLAVRRPWIHPGPPFPLKIPVLVLLLSAAISLPLNARETYYFVWALPIRDLFFQWLGGNPGAPLHGLRLLTNLASAALLAVAVYRSLGESAERFMVRHIQAMVLLTSLVIVVGFLFLFQWIPRGRSYASLSLAGIHEGAITAFAFNRQFLAQYVLLGLPLAFFLGQRSLANREIPWLLVGVGTAILSLLALAASMQRSVYLVLALQTGFILVGTGRLRGLNPGKLRLLALVPLGILGGLLALDWAVFNQSFLRRLQFISQVQDIRPALWSAAWAMFTYSPGFGIGLGKYYYFFPDFFPGPAGAWQAFNANRGNAHSLWVQVLAEQGLFGALAWTVFVGALLIPACRGLTRESPASRQSLRFALLTTVATMLVLGLFHHITADLRSLELFFWMIAAFILVLAPRPARFFRPGWKLGGVFLGLLVVAFAFHLQRIGAYPLSKNFQAGFYHWETAEDGTRIRWMGARAAANLEPGPGNLIIECRAPLPNIETRPQLLRLWLDGREQRFTLGDRQWKRLRLPVPELRGPAVLLRLETGYTFNPAKGSGSPDRRDLGLQIREIRWETSNPKKFGNSPTPQPPPVKGGGAPSRLFATD